MRDTTATLRCSPASRRRSRTSMACWPGAAWPLWNDCWWRYAMHDVLDELYKRWADGEVVGLGTVVSTFSSAPRTPGAAMLVGQDGTVVGSVSGGCVEGAVYELAQQVVADGKPVLQRYGVSDDDAFAVGLTCGGIIDIYVEKVDKHTLPELAEVVDSVHQGKPVAVVTVVEHADEQRLGRHMIVWPDRTSGTLGTKRVDDAVVDDARGLLATGRTDTLHYGLEGERRGEGMSVFVNTF